MIFVNILCGKSYFDKKSVSFLFHLPTLKVSSEASSKPFYDWLDIFPDAIDLKITLAVLILALVAFQDTHPGILAKFSQGKKSST